MANNLDGTVSIADLVDETLKSSVLEQILKTMDLFARDSLAGAPRGGPVRADSLLWRDPPLLYSHDPELFLRAFVPPPPPPTFCGIRVVESSLVKPIPRVRISPDFPYVSDKFRREWDAWALERFGADDVAYICQGGILMNPLAVVSLRNCT